MVNDETQTGGIRVNNLPAWDSTRRRIIDFNDLGCGRGLARPLRNCDRSINDLVPLIVFEGLDELDEVRRRVDASSPLICAVRSPQFVLENSPRGFGGRTNFPVFE
jgi:hypothetical protein